MTLTPIGIDYCKFDNQEEWVATGSLRALFPRTGFPSIGIDSATRTALKVAPRVVIEPSLTLATKRGETPADNAGTLVDGEWRILVPAVAKTLDERREATVDAINLERDIGVFRPIGQIDVAGDGSKMVEPDIRHEKDRANLGDLHTRALALMVSGVTAAVMKFGAADNIEYLLTPAEMLVLVQAVFDRGSARYVRARALKTWAVTASNADLETLDLEAGSIDGVGSWASP